MCENIFISLENSSMSAATNNQSPRTHPIVAAWVDQGIGESGMHQYIKERFGTLSPFITQWLYFDCSDQFIDYIEKNPSVRLISVMSGGMSRLLVPQYSHYSAFHSVYVFCVDIDRAKQSLDGEVKVKGIFNIEDDLYDQMAEDLARILLDDGVALAQVDERSVARQNYEEAKRLITTQANKLKDTEKQTRLEEINGRIDQLLV